MKILLVEDDEHKGVQLREFIEGEYLDAEVSLAMSLQSGIRLIRKAQFDLVLLDMTLPNYDAGPEEPGGGNTYSFGGREFLKQMDRFDILTPVVVVTQFETFGKGSTALDLGELNAQLTRDHSPVYGGAVYYNASIHGWKEELVKTIERLLPEELRRRAP